MNNCRTFGKVTNLSLTVFVFLRTGQSSITSCLTRATSLSSLWTWPKTNSGRLWIISSLLVCHLMD